MPIVMEHKMVFVSLFALALNTEFKYRYYFQIAPPGPDPYFDWSEGFFTVPSEQKPKPATVALLGVDNEFGINALIGAKKNAEKFGFTVIYEQRHSPATVDDTPILRAIKAANPDMVYGGSLPPDSLGIVRAAKEAGLKPKVFGGGMVGLQLTPIQQQLGRSLNGILNFAYWVPEPTLNFPGIEAFLKKYQARAPKEGVDPIGFYLAPWAYAVLQVLGQGIDATKSLDQATVGEHIRTHELETGLTGEFELALRKDLHLTWPRAETPTHYITMGLDLDLDDAAKQALREMIDLLGREQGISRADAYTLCSLACDLHVTQLVDGNKGIHAMLRKDLFV
jgi:branched-chain amino acid transport system substrate-binding protein